MNITLKPFEDADIELLERWLGKEHVQAFFSEPEDWLQEARERHGDFSFLHHFIVYVQGVPIGFCQYYDCFDAQEEWYSVQNAGKTYSIDYMIGEESYLRQGYGKQIVQSLINMISALWDGVEIVVQPDMENLASCNTLLACGFTYKADREYYSLRVY